MSDPASPELPDFDGLWDYQKPDATEQAFLALLPAARKAGDTAYEAELLTQIARTRGLQRRFDEGHQTIDEVDALLGDEATPSRPRVRRLLERGRLYNSGGKPERARPLFLEAWNLAREIGADFHAVDAAHMVAIVEKAAEDQMKWNLEALAAAEASEDPRARGWLGALYNNIGWTYHDQEQYAEALDLFEKGLGFRTERGQSGTPIRIARWTIGRTLRSLGRIDDALALQESLLDEWKQAGEESGYVHEELGECLLVLGRADDARPHFARAHAVLSEDAWLAEHQAERLARLEKLGQGS